MVNIEREVAPGSLESVRALLNTWLIPNDTRRATDVLPELRLDESQWTERLGDLPRPDTQAGLDQLSGIRDGLRRIVEQAADPDQGARWLDAALRSYPVTVHAYADGDAMGVSVTASDPRQPEAVVLSAFTSAIDAGTWRRLKACRDCRWVFYDHSRSGTKIWCGMNVTGPNGRSCGSIAKVKAYRSRQAAQKGRAATTAR